MTDWKKMASALDPAIPEADAEKVVAVLNALEVAWRPLQAAIPAGTDLWTGPEDIA